MIVTVVHGEQHNLGNKINLSISNIAWPHYEDDWAFEVIGKHGFSAIEIAPSRIWPDFRRVSSFERKEYKKRVGSFGLEICSIHSLFWGINGVSLFGTPDEKKRLTDYFTCLIDFAKDLGVPRMVFGSPAVRKRGDIPMNHAYELASEILYPVSEYAYNSGIKILIEPLSVDETDFIVNHKEGLELVQSVDSDGFGLHLDAKAICSEHTPIEGIISDCKGIAEHFHVNEKGLGSFRDYHLPHRLIAETLKSIEYRGYVSIEMKQLDDYRCEIPYALDYIREIYAS